jgi:hypothetical protein
VVPVAVATLTPIPLLSAMVFFIIYFLFYLQAEGEVLSCGAGVW